MSSPASDPQLRLANERMPQQYIDDALSCVSTGRNIALSMVASTWESFKGTEIDQIFNGLLLQHGSNHTISRNYSRSQFLNWPPSGICTLDAGSGEFSGTEQSDWYSAFGAHVERVSARHDIAPVDLVGMRGAPRRHDGLEPYYARLALYGALKLWGANRPLSIPNLSIASTVYEDTVHNHVPALARSGVIEELRDGRRFLLPSFRYVETDYGEMQDLPGWNERTKDLAALSRLFAKTYDRPIAAHQVRQELKNNNLLESLIESGQVHRQNELINKVMEWLSEHGYLELVDPGQEITSEIALTDEGLEIIDEYFEIIGNLANQNPKLLVTGQRITQEVLADPARLVRLLTVDFEKGALTKRKPATDRADELFAMIANHPEGLTSRQMMEMSGLKSRALNKALRGMETKQSVRGIKVARSIVWFANRLG